MPKIILGITGLENPIGETRLNPLALMDKTIPTVYYTQPHPILFMIMCKSRKNKTFVKFVPESVFIQKSVCFRKTMETVVDPSKQMQETWFYIE